MLACGILDAIEGIHLGLSETYHGVDPLELRARAHQYTMKWTQGFGIIVGAYVWVVAQLVT